MRGIVPHYAEKLWAPQACHRVSGVKAVVEELYFNKLSEKIDKEISRAAIGVIKWNYPIPDDIKISVSQGWVTISGEVDWEYQRKLAIDAISELVGISGVINKIRMKAQVKSEDVTPHIQEALKRSAENEGKKFGVSVKGTKVTLTGIVQSFSVVADARMAAWNAPGVTSVENKMKIEP